MFCHTGVQYEFLKVACISSDKFFARCVRVDRQWQTLKSLIHTSNSFATFNFSCDRPEALSQDHLSGGNVDHVETCADKTDVTSEIVLPK